MSANHIARITAKHLSLEFGDGLPNTVEEVIQSASARPGQYIDLGALASIGQFIVAAAHFAYDWKKDHTGEKIIDIEALKRLLRLKIERPEDVTEKEGDAIIEAVAEAAKTDE